MRSSSGAVVGIGVGLMVLSMLNHFVLKANPIAYTSKIAFALGLVVALGGVALAMAGGAKSSE